MSRARHSIFSYYHPAAIFAYFVAVIGCALCTLNPIYVATAFVCSAAYVIYQRGLSAYAGSLRFTISLFLIVVAFNPLFNGLGMSVLFYVGGTPITSEALLYGVCSAGSLASMLQWFMCYQDIMTSDKFLALFGRVVPTTAMMVSMVLRYVPLVSRKASQVQLAQDTALGHRRQGIRGRVRSALRLSSVLMGWSMESSIETADSMRARGYGERKRTHFTNERFTTHDGLFLTAVLVLLAANLFAIFSAANDFAFYPTITTAPIAPWMIGIYTLLLLLPLLLEGREVLAWRFSNS